MKYLKPLFTDRSKLYRFMGEINIVVLILTIPMITILTIQPDTALVIVPLLIPAFLLGIVDLIVIPIYLALRVIKRDFSDQKVQLAALLLWVAIILYSIWGFILSPSS